MKKLMMFVVAVVVSVPGFSRSYSQPNSCSLPEMLSVEELAGKSITVTELLQVLDKKGYRPAALTEGLTYARIKSEEQKVRHILFLGSVSQSYFGWQVVQCFHKFHDEKKVSWLLFWHDLRPEYYVAVVRK